MPRLLIYIIGPETFWLIVCLGVRAARRRNASPDLAIARWLESNWAWLPLAVVPLTFACFFVPETSRWWLLLRIDLAIAIGLFSAATIYANGLTYHQPGAGPGAGTAFMVIIAMGYAAALLGTIAVAITLWWRGRGHS